MRIATGSANEVEVLLEMLKDLDYIDEQKYGQFIEEYQVLGKRLNVLLSKWK